MKTIGVIRSLGERTEKLAQHELEKQVDELILVKDIRPLTKTVITCLEIFMDSPAEIMITNDADVVVHEGAIAEMIQEIKITDCPLLTAWTMSKFFGERQGGIRVWKKENLREKIDFLKNNKEFVRPEAAIHHSFGGKLFQKVNSKHDFDQFYRDIYDSFSRNSEKLSKKKGLIRTFKNKPDVDFLVAYHGFFDPVKNFRKSFPSLEEKLALDKILEVDCG